MQNKQNLLKINSLASVQELGKASNLTLGYANGTMLEYEKPRGFRIPPGGFERRDK